MKKLLLTVIALAAISLVNADDTTVTPPCQICTKPNEVFLECGTACPLSCDKRVQNELCIDLCVRGCFCKEGFLRNKVDGSCVLPSECPCTTTTASPTTTTPAYYL